MQVIYAAITVTKVYAGWAWAKLRGKSYDSGMEA
jgi:hypothetical protein